LVDPNDSDAVDYPRRRSSQLGGGRQLCFQFLECLGCFSGCLSGVNTFASAGELFRFHIIFLSSVRIYGSHLMDEVSKANNLGVLAVPMIRGWIIGAVQRPPRELMGECSVAAQ